MQDDELASLQHLADLAAGRSGLCAGPMAKYQAQTGMSNAELAARLKCTLQSLVRLRLCEMPQNERDIATIAAHLDIDAAALTEFFHLSAQG